jgi:hypothetical protein
VLGTSVAVASLHAAVCPPGQEQFLSGQTQNGQVVCIPDVVSHKLTTFGIGLIVFVILVGIFSLICQVKIITKAGYSGWYVLTGFVPILGTVMFLIFVFRKWPIQERLERAERGVGRGYPPGPFTGMPGPPPGGGPGPAPYGGPPTGPPAGSFVPQPQPAMAGAGPGPGPGPVAAPVAVAPAPGPVAVAVGGQPGVGSNVIFCSWCGKERAVDAQAIHYCGSMERPAAYCMTCGRPLDGATSCTSCGTPSSKISR